MTHKHKWVRDNSRKHGRPPRFFVKCSDCSERAQAVITSGYLSVFKTAKPKSLDPKKVRSVRLSDREIALIESGKLSLTVRKGRITLAV